MKKISKQDLSLFLSKVTEASASGKSLQDFAADLLSDFHISYEEDFIDVKIDNKKSCCYTKPPSDTFESDLNKNIESLELSKAPPVQVKEIFEKPVDHSADSKETKLRKKNEYEQILIGHGEYHKPCPEVLMDYSVDDREDQTIVFGNLNGEFKYSEVDIVADTLKIKQFFNEIRDKSDETSDELANKQIQAKEKSFNALHNQSIESSFLKSNNSAVIEPSDFGKLVEKKSSEPFTWQFKDIFDRQESMKYIHGLAKKRILEKSDDEPVNERIEDLIINYINENMKDENL